MRTPHSDARSLSIAVALALAAAAIVMPRVRLDREVIDAVAFIDITGSMNTRDMGAADTPTSRLDAAKAAVLALIEDLPCQSRLGLGLFTERRSFLLIDPIEVCQNFAPLSSAVADLEWRMAWEGDSFVAKGLYSAYAVAENLGANLVFLSDGHEAPPLPPGAGLPEFEGKPGAVKGLLVGVGSREKSPIPKYDDEGREIGTYGPSDVVQENRTGPPPKDAEQRPGYHPKWAPFGSGPPEGDEHLTSVRVAHLQALATHIGLAFAELSQTPSLAAPLAATAATRRVSADADLRPLAALLALAILAAVYGLPVIRSLFQRFGRQPSWSLPNYPNSQGD